MKSAYKELAVQEDDENDNSHYITKSQVSKIKHDCNDFRLVIVYAWIRIYFHFNNNLHKNRLNFGFIFLLL